MVTLVEVQGEHEASVIKGLLESHGIPCMLSGNVAQGVHPFTMDGLGAVRIQVNDGDEQRARTILEEHLENPEPEAD
jgi:hypothetical protein